jgi:hypothetical protein
MATLYAPRIVTDGLVLCLDAANPRSYPGSGASWVDVSGNGNTGTLTNGPTFSGDNGGVIVLDGVNDYAAISAPSPFSGTKLFTFEMWVNFTSITGNFGSVNKGAWLFGGGTGTGGGQSHLAVLSSSNTTFTPATIAFGRGGGGTTGTLSISVSTLMSNLRWYQIILTRSSTSAQALYLNGINIGSGNVSNSFDDGQTDFGAIHGSSTFSGFLNGKIGGIRTYNRALTAAEVLQNYNATRSRFGI